MGLLHYGKMKIYQCSKLAVAWLPRQLTLCSGNHYLGRIKGWLPEKNSPDNPGKKLKCFVLNYCDV